MRHTPRSHHTSVPFIRTEGAALRLRKTHPRREHRVVVINARRRLSDQSHRGERRRCGLPAPLLIVSLSYERQGDFPAVSTHRSLPHSLRQFFHTFLFKFRHIPREVMLPFSNIYRGPRVVVLFCCLRRWKSVMDSLRLPLVI